MGIAWPAFLLAALLEMLVFAMVDPSDLHGLSGQRIDAPRQAVYTVAFFVFWAVTAASSALTVVLVGATGRPPSSHSQEGRGGEFSRKTAD
ncbi:hypothetical protein [Hydrogenophaga sp.]|uniref:hypothetical protein n=1 Tax=Hydrogenophaga sp. TaxID=1904254 RepID=UPI00351CB9D3